MDKRWANALYCMIMLHFAMVITVISPLIVGYGGEHRKTSSSTVFSLLLVGVFFTALIRKKKAESAV